MVQAPSFSQYLTRSKCMPSGHLSPACYQAGTPTMALKDRAAPSQPLQPETSPFLLVACSHFIPKFSHSSPFTSSRKSTNMYISRSNPATSNKFSNHQLASPTSSSKPPAPKNKTPNVEQLLNISSSSPSTCATYTIPRTTAAAASTAVSSSATASTPTRPTRAASR